MSVPDDAVSPVPNDDVSPVPDDVVILRPFTVRRLDNHVTGKILQTLYGVLLSLTVLNIFFCLIAGDADEKKSDAATADGWAFLLGIVLVGIAVASLYARIGRRLEVDRDGVRIPKGDTSIPWDLLEDAFVRTGARPLPISRLVFVTPIGPVRSPVPGGSCTRSGNRRLRQLAETILSYRDQIRTGTAQWEPNETRAQHGLRRWQGVTWLVFALGVIALAIYLAAKYAPTGV